MISLLGLVNCEGAYQVAITVISFFIQNILGVVLVDCNAGLG